MGGVGLLGTLCFLINFSLNLLRFYKDSAVDFFIKILLKIKSINLKKNKQNPGVEL